MRKLTILLFALILLFSCSNNDDNSNQTSDAIKPKKITVTEIGSSPYYMNFEYNGNLISKITFSFGRIVTLNYNSNNTIANYTIQNSGITETFTATYQNNLLKQLVNNTNTDKTIFYYDTNNKVTKTEYFDNSYLTTTFYQYDSIGNVIQSNDNYSTFQFLYDSSNNPFKNVFPQTDPEVYWPWFGSLINNPVTVKEKLSSATSFTTKYIYTYEYNSQNFATKRTQKSPSGTIWETVTFEY